MLRFFTRSRTGFAVVLSALFIHASRAFVMLENRSYVWKRSGRVTGAAGRLRVWYQLYSVRSAFQLLTTSWASMNMLYFPLSRMTSSKKTSTHFSVSMT